jgi:hypothetical protein
VDPLAGERSWLTPYNFVQNNPIMRIDPDGMLDDWFENQAKEIVWFDRDDQEFTDDQGGNWKNIGKTLCDVKKHLNVPSNQSISESDLEWISVGGGEGGYGMITAVSIKLDAYVSFDLKTNQTFPGKLVDGQTKVTGISMNVSLIATTLNTINLINMGGNFSYDKEWTASGHHARVESSSFQEVNQDVIGTFNSYAYSSAKADLKTSYFQSGSGNNTIYINPAIKYSHNSDGFKSGILTPTIEKKLR